MNTWLSSIDSRCSYSVSQVWAFMLVVHTSNCHGQKCTRRAIFGLGIDTLITNILVSITLGWFEVIRSAWATRCTDGAKLGVEEWISTPSFAPSVRVMSVRHKNYHTSRFNLISVELPCSTRSSLVVTCCYCLIQAKHGWQQVKSEYCKKVSWPPTSSSLRITDRSFRYASPYLWNQLRDRISLRQLVPVSPFMTHLFLCPSIDSPLSASLAPPSLSHSLKTYLYHESLPP